MNQARIFEDRGAMRKHIGEVSRLSKLIITCSLVLGVLSPAVASAQKAATAPSSEKLTISGNRLFESLNLDYPGMEAVKEAVAACDWPAAKKALLAHMRSRKSPRFIVDRWRREEYLSLIRSGFAEAVEELPAAANLICEHDFTFEGFHRRFDGEVIWDRTKSGMSFVFGCWLNRMWYLETLGQAWWLTGERKYARSGRDLVDSWIKSCPMPPVVQRHWHRQEPPVSMCVNGNPWGQSLEVADRLGSWTVFNEYFVDSPEITPEFYYRFLVSLLEQARYIYTIESQGYAPGNWSIVECSGLARVAIMFPEFTESADWWKQLKALFAMQAEKTILPDGVQVERTIGYHNWCYAKFRDVLLLASLNGSELPEGFAETVERMRLYPEKIAYPGWQGIPGLGDAGVRWWGTYPTGRQAEKYRDEAGRYRLLWQIGLDAYEQWEKQRATTSTEMPYAGLFVMRTGWDMQDKYLIFDCVPPSSAGGHWHNSALNVDLYAFGRVLIVDPGMLNYSHSSYRDYFRRVRAHNIIELAGEENRNDPKLNRWLRSQGFDLAEGEVSAPLKAKMSRRVLFVRGDYWIVDDRISTTHSLPARAYWHLNSRSVVVGGRQVKLAAKGDGPARMHWMGGAGKDLSFHTNDPGIGNILVFPDGGEKYVSLSLLADTPCGGHVACYRQDAEPPTKTALRFTTLLYPFEGDNRPQVSFRDGVVKIGDDRVDTYFRKGEQTDGDCALVSRRAEAVERVLLVAGSYVKDIVRADGEADFLIITRRDKGLDIQLITAAKVGRIELPGFVGVEQVTVNGKPRPVAPEKGVPVVPGPFDTIKPEQNNPRLFWIIE